MAITIKQFNQQEDFHRISDFLFSLYEPMNRDGNWVQPIWEYSYAGADMSRMSDLGIWQDGERIVAFIYYDTDPADLTLAVDPGYRHLKEEMVAYAQERLFITRQDGKKQVKILIADFDDQGREILEQRGFLQNPRESRTMSWFDPKLKPFQTDLPEGFHFKSLVEDNDLRKIDRCLHRGFNHPGEPPEDSIAGRIKIQSAPHFRKDLNIVVEAPSGDFVVFAGMWFDEINSFGYVEPVATDPDYRNLGLGRAAVMESIRRCCDLGADGVWVWSDMGFYLSFGFKPMYKHLCFVKVS